MKHANSETFSTHRIMMKICKPLLVLSLLWSAGDVKYVTRSRPFQILPIYWEIARSLSWWFADPKLFVTRGCWSSNLTTSRKLKQSPTPYKQERPPSSVIASYCRNLERIFQTVTDYPRQSRMCLISIEFSFVGKL